MENKDNLKKILCFNMINNGYCNYGTKCLYAHDLSEQKIEPDRLSVYTLIKGTNDLNNINLLTDEKLYNNLLQLTKICVSCFRNLCPGGYNCRNGTIHPKYRVCYDDLVYGNCKKPSCSSIHLTNRGLICYNQQKKNKRDSEFFGRQSDINKDNKIIEITDNSELKQKNYNKHKKHDIHILKRNLNNVQGVLLDEKFILTHFGRNINNNTTSDSDDDEEIKKMKEYINNDSESADESIFID